MTLVAKRRAALVVIVLVATIGAKVIPQLLAQREAMPRTAIGYHEEKKKKPVDINWLLVIGRRAERMRESDPTPFRNSRIALYERNGANLRKVSRDFAIRSRTTDQRIPEQGELDSLGGVASSGFVSVPTGFFSLKKGPWRYPGEIGFLISDWNRNDGVIVLKTPQVIEQVRSAEGDTTYTTTVLRSSHDKTGSWLHMTQTQTWSYLDSNGCMNLFKPVGSNGISKNAPSGPYDWDELLKVLEEKKLVDSPPMLYVALWDEVGEGDNLRPMLEIDRLKLPRAIAASD